MAEIYHDEKTVRQKIYVDRKHFSDYNEQVAALRGSRWLYVGNLSFHTTDMQVRELFSRVGPVNSVIMGQNNKTNTPCGFCFVEYATNRHALESVAVLSGTTLDDRVIRVELDFGYMNGRHFGRGQSGGQVRDDRIAFDPGRSWLIDTKYGSGDSGTEPDGERGSQSSSLTGGGEKRGRSRREYDEDQTAEEEKDREFCDSDAGTQAQSSAADIPSQTAPADGGDNRPPKRRRRGGGDSDDEEDEEEDAD